MNDQDRTSATEGDRNTHPSLPFFGWIRDFGLARSDDRWLAGVCGGIAQRTRLDPLIIRGIAIVVALLGGPIFLAYAAGWALLPDSSGRIHLERLIRGVFDPAIIAIGVLVVLTFMPFTQGIWWQGPPTLWGMPGWLETTLRVGWALALVAGIVWLVVFLARRMPVRGDAGDRETRETGAARPDFWTRPDDTGSGEATTASFAGEAADAQPDPGASWGRARWSGPSDGENDPGRTWEERHRHHREQVAELRRCQAERRAQWRAVQPSAAFVSIGLGLAVLAGALASVWAMQTAWSDAALVIGLATGLAVVAIATIVSGLRGRENGALGFFGVAGAVALLAAAVLPSGTNVSVFGPTTWHVTSSEQGTRQSFAMFAGGPTIDMTGTDADDSGGEIDLWLAFGESTIRLPDDAPTRVVVSGFITGVDDAASRDDDRGGMFYSTTVENDLARHAPDDEITTVRVRTFIGSVDVQR